MTELHDLLPHAMVIRSKVMTAVGTANHRSPSLYKVYRRALSMVLSSVWNQVNQNADADATVDNDQTPEHFDARLKEFIRIHSTAEDRYELAQDLRTACKRRDLPVQAFWYKLREVNTYIDWLPGNEPALNDNQLRQAFHDAMPPTWRERFTNAGNSIATLTMAETVRYFRTQEHHAARKMTENNSRQKKEAIVKGREKNGSPKRGPPHPYKHKDEDKRKPKGATTGKKMPHSGK